MILLCPNLFFFFAFQFQYKFNLYIEVKRTTGTLEEFDANNKRIWIKVNDIDDNLYSKHYVPTVYNTNIKILTTEQYVPIYLKNDVSQNTGN